ncbi:MAG: hypothetical protein WBG43_01490 [Marinifilaceae bacterium]
MNEKLRTSILFDSIYNKIIQDENFQKTVMTFVDNVRNQHIKNDYHMGIDEEDIFTMRYQTYVSRNSLSGEFALLAKRYHPKYKTMKKYAYNSIRYSFLTDIKKEQMHNNLDIRFKAFKKIMANYTEGINHNN